MTGRRQESYNPETDRRYWSDYSVQQIDGSWTTVQELIDAREVRARIEELHRVMRETTWDRQVQYYEARFKELEGE
jgi:hypothetical protein